jgi:hypothetical protein
MRRAGALIARKIAGFSVIAARRGFAGAQSGLRHGREERGRQTPGNGNRRARSCSTAAALISIP